MANAAAVIWGGIRHPARTVLKRWSDGPPVALSNKLDNKLPDKPIDGSKPRAVDRPEDSARSARHARYPAHPSSERLERIALFARSGYFHMDYTAGLFVVPFDIAPE